MKDYTAQITEDLANLAKLETGNEDLKLKTLDQVKQHMKDHDLLELTLTINDVEFTFDYHKPGAGDQREDFGFTFTGPIWYADSDSLPEDLLKAGTLEEISDYIIAEGEWFAKHQHIRSTDEVKTNESYLDWMPLKGFVYKTLQDIVYLDKDELADELDSNPDFNAYGILTALEQTDAGLIIPAGSRIEIIDTEHGEVDARISKAGLPIDKAVELPITDVNGNFNEIFKLETVTQDVDLSESGKFKAYLKANSDLTEVYIGDHDTELMHASISDLENLSAVVNRAIYVTKTRGLHN